MAATTFSITALCREFEVTPRALRFYEDRGLLNPMRRGQARLYSPADRARLSLILRGKRLGFSLTEIAQLLELYDPADGGALQLERSLAAVGERIAQLERQRHEIDQVLCELTDVQQAMRERREALEAGAVEPLPRAEDYDRLIRARVDGDTPLRVRA
jgi:DNA-binding transcriptional MerR regulator